MPDSIAAAPQPAATQAPSGANSSSDNVTGSQVQAMLRRRAAPPPAPEAPAPAEHITPAPQAPEPTAENQSAEEVVNPAPASEAQPEATPDNDEAPVEIPKDVLSQLNSLDPKTRKLVEQALEEDRKRNQDKIDRRIGKERAKRGDIEKQLQQEKIRTETLANQLRQIPQQPQVQNSATDVSQIETPEGLYALQQQAKEVIRFADDALDRDDIANGINVDGKVWTKEDLKSARRQARVVLEDQIPERARLLQDRQAKTAAALEKFPTLAEVGSEDNLRAVEILKDPRFSSIRNAPNAIELVGTIIEGEKVLRARQQPIAPTPKPPPAPVPIPKPRPPGDQVPATVAGSSDRTHAGQRSGQVVQQESERLNAKGNVSGSEVRQFLKLRDSLRNSS